MHCKLEYYFRNTDYYYSSLVEIYILVIAPI